MSELISDRELARRVGNGERPTAVKIGLDCWRIASVDTLPEGGDAQLGSVRSKGSAVPKADAQTPFTPV